MDENASYDNLPLTPSEWMKTSSFDAARVNYRVNIAEFAGISAFLKQASYKFPSSIVKEDWNCRWLIDSLESAVESLWSWSIPLVSMEHASQHRMDDMLAPPRDVLGCRGARHPARTAGARKTLLPTPPPGHAIRRRRWGHGVNGHATRSLPCVPP